MNNFERVLYQFRASSTRKNRKPPALYTFLHLRANFCRQIGAFASGEGAIIEYCCPAFARQFFPLNERFRWPQALNICCLAFFLALISAFATKMPRPSVYQRYTTATRLRVVQAARDGRDWRALAAANGVNPNTAATWVARDDAPPVAALRAGGRPRLLEQPHLDHLERLLADNCLLSLEQMATSLDREFGLSVSRQTVGRAIDGLGYSLKATHLEKDAMNTLRNKEKRKDFLLKLLEYQAAGKHIFYMDETNINLWCSRGRGWSKKGRRAVKLAVVSRGRNMHVIACIGNDGIGHWEHQFGSFKKPECQAFVRRVFDQLRLSCDLTDVVLVVDNAPCHSAVEDVLRDVQYSAATILRLGPYSPMLNPIENVFSAFKSQVKSFLARSRREIVSTPHGVTQVSHRSEFLVRAAERYFPAAATPALCRSCTAHTLRFHGAVLMLADVAVGE